MPYRDGRFVLFLLLTLGLACVFFQVQVTLPLAMKANGLSPGVYGFILAQNGAMVVALSPAVSSVVLRLPRRITLALASLLTAVAMVCFGFGGANVSSHVLGMTIYTLGEVVMAPVNPALVSELAPAERRGSYQGAFQLALSCGACLAPLIGGGLMATDRSDTLWLGATLLAVLVAVGHWLRPFGVERASSLGATARLVDSLPR